MKRSCLVALALLLAFCGVAAVGAVPNPDTFIWATFAGWDSFDPAWCYDTSSGEAIYHIYDSLVGYIDTSLAELRPILAIIGGFLGSAIITRCRLLLPFRD